MDPSTPTSDGVHVQALHCPPGVELPQLRYSRGVRDAVSKVLRHHHSIAHLRTGISLKSPTSGVRLSDYTCNSLDIIGLWRLWQTTPVGSIRQNGCVKILERYDKTRIHVLHVIIAARKIAAVRIPNPMLLNPTPQAQAQTPKPQARKTPKTQSPNPKAINRCSRAA